MDTCPNCGGTMIGDGYTSVVHCENADDDDALMCAEPDAPPILCKKADAANKAAAPSGTSGRYCSTLWRLHFVMPNAAATVWLMVDGPMPLAEHLAALDMSYCVRMDLVSSRGMSMTGSEL